MNPFTWIKNQSLFRDGRAVALVVIALMMLIYIIFYSVTEISNPGFKVSIRYSGYFEGRLNDKGEWFLLYVFPLFALTTLLINTLLAMKVHRLRAEVARIMLLLNLVVLLFAIFITRAVLSL